MNIDYAESLVDMDDTMDKFVMCLAYFETRIYGIMSESKFKKILLESMSHWGMHSIKKEKTKIIKRKSEKEEQVMYLIAGLGNPGKEYDMTRHNIGFHTIDYIADKHSVKVNKLKYKALYGECRIGTEKVLLIKPQTYMNNSGESIIDFVKFYKVPIENVIIISDDVSLECGRIRVRGKGSAGGHNGLKSIIYHLQSDAFPRVKMGVGAPKHDMINHVLGRFAKDEIPVMEDAIIRADGAAEEIIKNGVSSAMNRFNAAQ